ncbi:MAG: DUF5696 domain-containing protein [Victivallaceae bacterium]|nr:DUF5696 domain-containing protein [Victivallaceae bacterium]
MIAMTNKFFEVSIDDNNDGGLLVRDKRTNKEWKTQDTPFIIEFWSVHLAKIRTVAIGHSCDYAATFQKISNNKIVAAYSLKDPDFAFSVEYSLSENFLEVSVPYTNIVENTDYSGIKVHKEYLFKLFNIRLLPRFGAVKSGESGYMLLPNHSGVICSFDKKYSGEHRDMIYGEWSKWEYYPAMPVFGAVHEQSGFLGIITSGEFDAEVVTEINNGKNKNSISPCFHYRYNKTDEIDKVNRTVRYCFLADREASYVGMAKTYRNYLLNDRKLLPLKSQIRQHQELKYAYDAYNFIKIFCCEKNIQYDGKGELKIYTTFSDIKKIMDHLKTSGIDKALITLVGWNIGGHDGTYPSHFPIEPGLGGENELRNLIEYAKHLDYEISLHDNYTDAYELSPDWQISDTVKDRDGWPVLGGLWCGGQSHILCPDKAIKYAKQDLPQIKELGINGTYYIDAMPLPLMSCHDKSHQHQINRRAFGNGVRQIASLARKMFGGCSIEHAYDFMSESITDVAQVIIQMPSYLADTELGQHFIDSYVPFYQIAYHGLIQYHFRNLCDGQYGKFEEGMLREIEYGAMPRNEITYEAHPVFGSYRKWLPLMKKQYDVICKELGYLQLEFIEDHLQIAPDVFETVYSDGSRVVVNYGNKEYANGDYKVKAQSYCLTERKK